MARCLYRANLSQTCPPTSLLDEIAICPHPCVQLILESEQYGQSHDAHGYTPTHSPEVALSPVGIDNALEIHSEIRSEEGQGQENDGNYGEDEDRFGVEIGIDGEFVLFYGS